MTLNGSLLLAADRGGTLTALFCDPSGAGRTLAAEILANELTQKHSRIDLSHVMSKCVGETEGNPAIMFDAVEKFRAVLFFERGVSAALE